MSLPLDQLRIQRELVKRHLDWLDARIIDAAGSDPSAPPITVPKFESMPVAAVVTTTSPVDSGPVSAGAPVALPAEVLLEVHAPEEFGISQGAKYGCVAIAAVVVLGFLFVLFVLPRFLYGDKKDNAPVEDPAAAEHAPVRTPSK